MLRFELARTNNVDKFSQASVIGTARRVRACAASVNSCATVTVLRGYLPSSTTFAVTERAENATPFGLSTPSSTFIPTPAGPIEVTTALSGVIVGGFGRAQAATKTNARATKKRTHLLCPIERKIHREKELP